MWASRTIQLLHTNVDVQTNIACERSRHTWTMIGLVVMLVSLGDTFGVVDLKEC